MDADTEPIDHVDTPDTGADARNPAFAPSLMFGLGPMVAFFVAALLVVGRDDIGTTNVALLIALVVVVAATADRAAGVATALVASLAYNFFHTEPYRSLRINDGQDILTVVLLIVIGLVVSEISARARTAISGRKRLGDAERSLERTAELLAGGADVSELWASIREDIIRLMHVADCRFEEASGSGPISDLPLVSRAGALDGRRRVWVGTGFELPESGAAIRVAYRDVELGQIALIPRAGSGSLVDERRLAIALADQFAVALELARRSG
jgi:K+-sensing histidine kinase KdpD